MKVKIDFLNPKHIGLSVNQCAGIALCIMSVFLFYTVLVGASAALYLFAVLVTGFFVLYYPEVGLIVSLVSTMWFERFFTLQPLIINDTEYKLYPLDVMLLFIGLGLLWQWYVKQLRYKWRRLDSILVVFGVVCTIGFARALFIRGDLALAFGTYKNYFLYAIVYVYAVLILDSQRQWERLMGWFTVGGLGLFFFVAYGLVARHGLWSDFTPLSTAGTRLLAGTHTFYLIIFGFWLLALFLWPEEGALKLSRHSIIASLAVVAVGIIVSLVRHLWLALAALSVVWLLALPSALRHELARLLGRAALILAALGIVYGWLSYLLFGGLPVSLSRTNYVFAERLRTAVDFTNTADSSTRWRIAAWQAGVGVWLRQPFFGTGIGQLVAGYDGSFSFEVAPREIHNDYLGMLIQFGLLGIIVVGYWFYYLIGLIKNSWKLLIATNAFTTRLLFTWGNTMLLFMLVFSVSIYWDINLFVVWWWLALAAVRFVSVEEKSH